jgi:hypothetical protein
MKPTVLIWTLAAPILTGVFILILLLMPSVEGQLKWWILGAAALASILAVPFSVKVGRSLEGEAGG